MSGRPVPLVILINGGSFVGKSSISMMIARRLSIPGIISTDYLREAIKPHVTESDQQILNTATFLVCELDRNCTNSGVIAGFLRQCELVLPSIQPIINRCLTHGERLIIEGIHLLPSRMKKVRTHPEVYFANIYTSPEQHRLNIKEAVKTTRFRGQLSNYVKYFDRIRAIHDYLFSDAQQNGLDQYQNTALNQTVSEILEKLGLPQQSE